MSSLFTTNSFIHYDATFDRFPCPVFCFLFPVPCPLSPVPVQTLRPADAQQDPVDMISLTKGILGRLCEFLGAEPGKIHEGELAAFLSYAVAYPGNFLPVIDSYSVSCSGLLNFCAVAMALSELGHRPRGENEINVVGVGTHLVTCTRQPSLGCVYKLVEVRGNPRMKFSEDPEKSTVPGKKAVYRLLDSEGHPQLDLLCLSDEPPPQPGHTVSCFPLGGRHQGAPRLAVTPTQVTCLRQEVFSKGQVRVAKE
ncbi:hypothetical protein CRUP_012138 [Coryphaenoides rupestris]|nr:hypothetical protein CRUP_012138 [Coryphaenoides rupestris]